MSNTIIALVLFIAVLGGLALFFSKFGKLRFWKLAARFPEKALEYVSSDPAWAVHQESEPSPGPGFAGPFLLADPSSGRTLALYAREDQIEGSQQRFLEMCRELLPRQTFPFLSLLALLYPVSAILAMAKTTAPISLILGYGFGNLGYLLAAAALIPGHFRILGMDYRAPTFIGAVVFWGLGFVLSNVAP